MEIDDPIAAMDCIIAKCDDTEELEKHLVYYASAVSYLLCHLAKKFGQDEAGIRAFYHALAEVAVDEYETPHSPTTSAIH